MINQRDQFIDNLFNDLKKKQVATCYSKFNLRSNPFPIAGLPTVDLPPIDSSIEEKIRHFIISTYNENKYSGLTIVGDYGSGKTHLLKNIKTIIDDMTKNAQVYKSDFAAVTVFIDRPDDSPQRVVHKIIEEIGVDKVRKYIWKIVINKLAEDIPEFEKQFRPKGFLIKTASEQWMKLFEEPVRSNYLDFLGHFKKLNGNFTKLQEKTRKIIVEQIVQDRSLADRYMDLILSEEEKEADTSWEVLAGHITKKDLQHKEIDFLNSIVEILNKVGFKHLYIFIDEFEDIGKLSSVKKTNYLLTLVTLINKSTHWSVIVSLTDPVLQGEIKKEPPLFDRLTTTRLDLKRLRIEEGKKLLSRYLNLVRDAQSNDTLPFTAEGVKRMLDISKGNCRSFLLLAYDALEIAAKDDATTQIDVNIVDKAKGLRGV